MFLGLGLKAKLATICRLRHKIDGRMKTVQGTHRDLAASFVWKQVELWFPSLASRLAEARRQVVHVPSSWKSRENQVEDGQVDVMGCVGPCYPYFVIFIVLGSRNILVF
jgi:hypothetical protein